MRHGILIPPGVRGKLKSRMKTCWSTEYRLKRYVCNFIDDMLCDLNEARFGLTKEVAMCYFKAHGNMPMESDMDATCEELIKKYPNCLEKMFVDGMRKKMCLISSMLLNHLRSDDEIRMAHHDILQDLLAIKWDNPNNMVHADTSIKALQIRLNYKLNDMDNFKRADSAYDGLVVVYPHLIEERLETLCSIIATVPPSLFKGIIAELDIMSKCIIERWQRNEKLTIRDYHEIAGNWISNFKVSDSVDGHRPITIGDVKKHDIDPVVVIMTDMFHEVIAQYSTIPDFLIMPGVQSMLRWYILERYTLNVRMKPPQEEDPDSECDCPISSENQVTEA